MFLELILRIQDISSLHLWGVQNWCCGWDDVGSGAGACIGDGCGAPELAGGGNGLFVGGGTGSIGKGGFELVSSIAGQINFLFLVIWLKSWSEPDSLHGPCLWVSGWLFLSAGLVVHGQAVIKLVGIVGVLGLLCCMVVVLCLLLFLSEHVLSAFNQLCTDVFCSALNLCRVIACTGLSFPGPLGVIL